MTLGGWDWGVSVKSRLTGAQSQYGKSLVVLGFLLLAAGLPLQAPSCPVLSGCLH